MLTITGTGFGMGSTVRVGGLVVPVVSGGPGRIVIQVPGSAGGQVEVRTATGSARCGDLQILRQ